MVNIVTNDIQKQNSCSFGRYIVEAGNIMRMCGFAGVRTCKTQILMRMSECGIILKGKI